MSDGCSCCDIRTVAAAGGGRDSRTRSDGGRAFCPTFAPKSSPPPPPPYGPAYCTVSSKSQNALGEKETLGEKNGNVFSAVENFFFSFFRLPPMGGCYGRTWEKRGERGTKKNRRRRRTREQRRSRAINFNTGKGEGALPFPIPFFPWPSVNYFFSLLRPSSSSR